MAGTKTYDRVVNFLGGMNTYLNPTELPPNQSQILQNMIVLDNGRAITRPGADSLGATPITGGAVPIKGMGFLSVPTYGDSLIVAKSTSLYSYNGTAWSTISLGGATWNPLDQVLMCQGLDKMLLSDQTNAMLLYNGNSITALTSGLNHAPKGVQSIAYIAGMFAVSGNAMTQDGTIYPADTIFFSDYLDATDNHWRNTNNIRVGNGDGDPIVALATVQTTSGTVPEFNLAVLKQNSVWLLTWSPASGTFTANWTAAPQGSITGSNIGCVGKNAWCNYNNDLMFMSQEGIYSLQRMQAATGQYQLTAPLSLPIQQYIDRINWSYAKNIQATKYKQYAIFFVPLDSSTTNNYALVWDGRMNQWTIWTGWNPSACCITRFNGILQFVYGDSTGTVNYWKDSKAIETSDSTYLDNGVGISWSLSTRAMIFGNLDFQKKLGAVQVRVNRGNATMLLSAYLDLADQDDWTSSITPSGITFPITLPVTFKSQQPVRVYETLEGIPYCNEVYIQIIPSPGTTGWIDIRNVVMSAYLKPFKNPSA